ncbi:MAG: hypothetical protein CVV60_04120 [Tenericutes bacterium HGW-Tenericutes-5]|nr:MAG: hypothetical protein CVV60_04120 [Tenericutes bacterium HGW-Tenericutes-5]
MLKRIYFLFFILFSLTFLFGCNKTTTIVTTTVESTNTTKTEAVVTLENSYIQMTRVFDDVFIGDVITLPIDVYEEKVFVGWSDGNEYYYGDFLVEQSITLTAVYEEFDDVFEYMIHPETFEISIEGYSGNAKYLRIPESFNRNKVYAINSYAFEGSSIIEVEIPVGVTRINTSAFTDSLNLQKISFYGGYSGEVKKIISSQEYDDIIQENQSDCQIIEDNETSWKFSEGCPITEVLSVSEVVYVPDLGSFYSYEVMVDIRYYDDISFYHNFNMSAFANLPSLTTFEFPERLNFFEPQIFSNTPNLINLVFEGNDTYQTINNVVYIKGIYNEELPNEDQYRLVYYPPALKATEFTVPDNVFVISQGAFMENNYLEVINLPKNLMNLGTRAFSLTPNLKEINISDENEAYYTIDGVLYAGDFLLTYPPAKTDKIYILPENIRMIAPSAFYGQRYLIDIGFNDGLERIGYDVFSETQKIKILNIPSSVVFMDSLYYRNSSIEVVIINRSVVTDGSITNIRTPRAHDIPTFYVPDDSFDDYRMDRDWSTIYIYIEKLSELSNS